MTPTDYATMLHTVAQRDLGALGPQLGAAFEAHLPPAAIDPPLRLAHFVAQIAHETGGFQWLVELGGPSYFEKYDGRRDLGNTQPGDGYRYRGRGLIQITGRANYADYGAKLDVDLLGDPDMAADPDTGTAVAALYWNDHGLSAFADADDIESITRRINGGLNGLADREAMLARAKAYLVTADP